MKLSKSKVLEPLSLSDTPLAFRMSIIAKQYYGAAHKHFEDIDLERNFFFLNFISKHKHISQQTLADCMHKDKTTIVHVIDYLSDKGLVKRIQNPDDRREHMIIATKKADNFINKISTGFGELNKKAFKGFNNKEKELFLNMMERIQSNVSELPSEDYSFQYIKRKK